MIFYMRYAVIIIILIFFFPLKRKQGVNNCFEPVILPVFATVASRLKSEQKEKENKILKLNTTLLKLINPNIKMLQLERIE